MLYYLTMFSTLLKTLIRLKLVKQAMALKVFTLKVFYAISIYYIICFVHRYVCMSFQLAPRNTFNSFLYWLLPLFGATFSASPSSLCHHIALKHSRIFAPA